MLNQLFRMVCCCIPALLVGMQAGADSPQLEPGIAYKFELHDKDVHSFSSPISGNVRVVVENLERGTFLICLDKNGDRQLRTANWRGPEHWHSAVLEIESGATFQVMPDEAVAPSGEFQITLHQYEKNEPFYAAELAMSTGADLYSRHFFGEADAREAALARFQAAAKGFARGGEKSRQADALFEAAHVNFELGDMQEAYSQLLAAGALWTELDDTRGIAAAENLRGIISWRTADAIDPDTSVTSLSLFESAAERRRGLGDTFYYAQAVNNLGLVYRDLGDAWLARQFFEEALQIWQGDIDLVNVALPLSNYDGEGASPWLMHSVIAMQNLGWAYEYTADMAGAKRLYERAIALSANLIRPRRTAESRNNLGALMYRTGLLQDALENYQSALAYFTSEARDEVWASLVYDNIGLVLRAAGDTRRARQAFAEALRLRTPERDPVGRAETLQHLAELSIENEDYSASLQQVEEALELLESDLATRILRGSLHDLIARSNRGAGNYDIATTHHDQAIDLYRAAGSRRGELRARTNRAMTHHAAGSSLRVLPELAVALEIAEQIDAQTDRSRILTEMAAVHTDRENFESAYQYATDALAISEELRSRLIHPVLLKDYAAVQREAYDILINAAIELERTEDAWIASDFARARRFTDMLRQGGFDIDQLDDAQRSRYEALRQSTAVLAEMRTDSLSERNLETAEQIGARLAPLLDEMDAILELARSETSLDETAPELTDIQSNLADGDVILEYHIGEYSSGLWQLRRDSIRYRKIPDREKLELASLAARDSIKYVGTNSTVALRDLSQLLRLDQDIDDADRHLIVIPDGPLQVLPFSALMAQSTDYSQPLISKKTLTYLPSATAIIEIRGRKTSPGRGIAVMADPVFGPDDPRVSKLVEAGAELKLAAINPELTRSADRAGRLSFPRLPGTHEESQAIQDAAANMDVLTLTGTDANLERVLAGTLDDYRILHFATHGILDTEEPALSGLVLSGVSKLGQPRRRFLRSQDIAALNLKADLVVLSGCDTGIGELVRGEGMVGLSRAFFYAGADQVVSSLWQVPDKATAELMGHFYREMLQNGQSAAEALRSAQLAVRANRRWREPYYWAAFILQGNWATPTSQDDKTEGYSVSF